MKTPHVPSWNDVRSIYWDILVIFIVLAPLWLVMALVFWKLG